MPSPRHLPILPLRSRQPDACSTQSRHSGNPYEFTIMSFWVTVGAFRRFARRTANGSSPSSCAIWSSRLSKAKRVFTVPWPRNAPFTGVLVSTR